jgi:hypothetical protein
MFLFPAMGSANTQMPGGVSRFLGPFASRIFAGGLILPLLATAAVASANPSSSGEAIGLGGGRLGEYLWNVEAMPQDGGPASGPGAAQRPCLLVGTKWQVGPLNFRRSRNRECAGATELTATGPPLTAAGAQPSTGGRPRLTAVGMIFAPAARRVRVGLAAGRSMTINLRAPSPAQAHEAGLERFRYAAFAVHGTWCVERMVSESASGRVLWDSGVDGYACATE